MLINSEKQSEVSELDFGIFYADGHIQANDKWLCLWQIYYKE